DSGDDTAGYEVWEHVNFEGKSAIYHDEDIDFRETNVFNFNDKNEISSIKIWGGLQTGLPLGGVSSIYFGSRLRGTSLKGNVIGISLQPFEQVHLPYLGTKSKPYVNDAIDGVFMSFFHGEFRDYDLEHDPSIMKTPDTQ
ncbi:MAG: hypothetical protein AAF512_11080, partial [Pseudomonadota bacterium]